MVARRLPLRSAGRRGFTGAGSTKTSGRLAGDAESGGKRGDRAAGESAVTRAFPSWFAGSWELTGAMRTRRSRRLAGATAGTGALLWGSVG